MVEVTKGLVAFSLGLVLVFAVGRFDLVQATWAALLQ
jgi:hypothetical protein